MIVNLYYRIRNWYLGLFYVPKPFVVVWNDCCWMGKVTHHQTNFETESQARHFCKRLNKRPGCSIVTTYCTRRIV